MDKAYDRNIYVVEQKPLVQATGIVAISQKQNRGMYSFIDIVKDVRGYKSVVERKEAIAEFQKLYPIDNHSVTLSIIPNE